MPRTTLDPKRALGSAVAAIALAAMVAACGDASSQESSANVTGTVAGIRVAATDQVGILGAEQIEGAPWAFAGVEVTNLANTCAAAGQGSNHPNLQVLMLVAQAPGSIVAPGTYTVGMSPSAGANAGFQARDASCVTTTSETAASGTLTLSEVGTDRIAGSFDVTFAAGEEVTGTFVAPICDANILVGGSDPICG